MITPFYFLLSRRATAADLFHSVEVLFLFVYAVIVLVLFLTYIGKFLLVFVVLSFVKRRSSDIRLCITLDGSTTSFNQSNDFKVYAIVINLYS